MVEFKKKKVKSHTLGEKLKQVREKANVSLNEIAKNTKIRKFYLEMLEEGRFDKLPPDVYVKGFLNSYAEYLGIEPADVMKLYEKERGIQRCMKRNKAGLKTEENRKNKFEFPVISFTPKIIASISFAIFVFFGGIYFYREVGEFSKAPRLVVSQPMDNFSIEGSSVEVVGITDKEGKIRINGQAVFVNEKGEFKETVSLQNGVNEIEVKAINRFSNEETKKLSVSAKYETDIAQENSVGAVMGAQDEQEKESVKLEIKIKEFSTWVLVTVDGKSIQNGTMLPGAIQLFEGKENISITAGRANQILVKLNGEELGALSEDAGTVRDVVFTPESTTVELKQAEQAVQEKEETNQAEKTEKI
jgi:transcriptional regulator with XRE-family HTH domain